MIAAKRVTKLQVVQRGKRLTSRRPLAVQVLQRLVDAVDGDDGYAFDRLPGLVGRRISAR